MSTVVHSRLGPEASSVTEPLAASIVTGKGVALVPAAAAEVDELEEAHADATRQRASGNRLPRERIRCTGDSFPAERAAVGLSPRQVS